MARPRRLVRGGKYQCNTCAEWLPPSDFYAKDADTGRLDGRCKSCSKSSSSVRYKAGYRPKPLSGARQIKNFVAITASRLRNEGLTREQVRKDIFSGIKCPYCFSEITWGNISYDHKNGGGSELQPTCLACNLLKNVYSDADFRKIVSILGPNRLRHYQAKMIGGSRVSRLEHFKGEKF